MTFTKQEGKDFKDEIIELEYSADVARRVTIDLRSKVSIASGGFNSQVAESDIIFHENFLKQFQPFLNFNAIALEANRFKLLKGYHNLIINKEVFQKLIEDSCFNIYSIKGQFGIDEAISGRLQNIAVSLVKDYINKFYAVKEKAFLSKYLTYDMLSHGAYAELFPASHTMIVKVPKKHHSFISELEAKIKEMKDGVQK